MREVSTFVYDSTPPWANDPFFRRGYSAPTISAELADPGAPGAASRPARRGRRAQKYKAGLEVAKAQSQARVRRRDPRRLRHRHRPGRALPGLLRAPGARDDGGLGPHADAGARVGHGQRRRVLGQAGPGRHDRARRRRRPARADRATRSTPSPTRAPSTPSTSAGGRSTPRRRSALVSRAPEQLRHVGHRRAQVGVRRRGQRRRGRARRTRRRCSSARRRWRRRRRSSAVSPTLATAASADDARRLPSRGRSRYGAGRPAATSSPQTTASTTSRQPSSASRCVVSARSKPVLSATLHARARAAPAITVGRAGDRR